MAALAAALKGSSQDATRRRRFEQAAANYRRLADSTSEYRQLALGKLMMVYGDDELNRPADLVSVARQYVQISPESAIGHVTLAKALLATGQEPAATAALLSARTAIRNDDAPLLATMIVDYVLKTSTSSKADLTALLDWADSAIDREMHGDKDNRRLLMTKAASASFRAERLETDPERQRIARSEAARAFEKFRDANPDRGRNDQPPPPAPDSGSQPPPPPPGFDDALQEDDKLIKARQYPAAAALWEKLIKSNPEFPPPHFMRAQALLLGGQVAAAHEAVKAARTAIAAAASARHVATTYLYDIVRRNKTIAAADAKLLLAAARQMSDEALKADPKYWEAAIYRSLIVRMQAEYETDPAVIKALTAEADRLRAEAEAMRRK